MAPPLARATAKSSPRPTPRIADLIGDIDPIKAATRKLTYADEEVIHFGIIPRTHRGIFAINELPDLQPRIQVGLLNIMEEQDIQIRGFNVRIPIDVLMVFTANPEDYTNRGSIITPLKDRIDSQILTHYPRTSSIGVEITRQEAWADRLGDDDDAVSVHVPHVFREIVEQVAFEARASEYVDQKSGVSARLTRAALEDLVSAAERRALVNGESRDDRPRVRPPGHRAGGDGQGGAGLRGRAGGRAERRARAHRQGRSRRSSSASSPTPATRTRAARRIGDVLRWFSPRATRSSSTPRCPFAAYAQDARRVDGAGQDGDAHHASPRARPRQASMMELALEALHQHSLLGKDLDEPETRPTPT